LIVAEQFSIRRATRDDAQSIARFNQVMARETEGKELNPERVLAGVYGLLEKPELGFYLVATHEDRIAGSLMVTYEWSDWRCGVFWWVQSVYVVPEFRRQGVYRSLYAHLKQLAEQTEGVCGFRLYVEKDNTRAQQTYESLGMLRCAYWLYEEETKSYVPETGGER